MRAAVVVLGLCLFACGGSPEDRNREGEQLFSEWEKTDDEATYRLAMRAFIEATKLEPDNALYHYNLGTAYASAGFFSEAVPEFETALKLNPNYQAARDNLELVREEWADDKKGTK